MVKTANKHQLVYYRISSA